MALLSGAGGAKAVAAQNESRIPLSQSATVVSDPAASPGAASGTGAALLSFSGPAAPSFVLPALDGATVALDAARGRVVLVHVFATWCEPCREELPALSRFALRHADTVTIFAIDVGEVDARVRRFFETLPVSFPVLLDRDRSMMRSWGVSALPTTFVLDAALRPRYRAVGDVAWDEPAADRVIAGLAASPVAVSPEIPAALREPAPAVRPAANAVTGEPPR
ncbi:TlpA disulfide reductase family protein [Azorhizobium sp. AG788]|uniref:TlpA family protein disulfide reductase n=1 Tax=Azorhizobium sp. AG788 TaxID=2183897 RepID=UPI003138CCED